MVWEVYVIEYLNNYSGEKTKSYILESKTKAIEKYNNLIKEFEDMEEYNGNIFEGYYKKYDSYAVCNYCDLGEFGYDKNHPVIHIVEK